MRRLSVLLAVAFMLAATIRVDALLAIPSSQDTDGDGLPDLQEDANVNGILDTGETNPYDVDTDGGGESDGTEVSAKRNPLDMTDDLTFDADGDGWVNGIELLHNTDPKKTDTDGDSIPDPSDPFPLDSKFATDADANGLPDEWEKSTGLADQSIPQSKVDDPDGDGITNAEELARGTNPLNVDTDRDGVDDKSEIDAGTNPSENACLKYLETDEVFADTKDHWSNVTVTRMHDTLVLPDDLPLVRGYKNGAMMNFAPNQPVTRYELLKMALFSTCTKLQGNTDNAKTVFSDVKNTTPINENDEWKQKRRIIYTAVHYGIVGGYADGTFKPDATVNRAEAVKIISLASQLKLSEASGAALSFSDVKNEDWFGNYVHLAADREIVRGYTDGTFRPEQPITRAEAATIVYRAMLQYPYVNGYVLPGESNE